GKSNKKKSSKKHGKSSKKKSSKKHGKSNKKKSSKKHTSKGSAVIATLSRKTGISKGIISLLTDLVGYNDIYTMITGKDAATGKKRSRLVGAAWTALNFVPVSKVAKLAKAAKVLATAKKAEKVAKNGGRIKRAARATKLAMKRAAEKLAKRKPAKKTAKKAAEEARKAKKAKHAKDIRATGQAKHEATHRAGTQLSKAKAKLEREKAAKHAKPQKTSQVTKHKTTKKQQKRYNKKKAAGKARKASYARKKGGTKKKSGKRKSAKAKTAKRKAKNKVKKDHKAKKASGPKVKIEISKERLEHANLGNFTIDPKTGKISMMKGGGHGQDNIDFLRKNGLEVNIEKTYPNGVRVGNVPKHKSQTKRAGTGQSWFPENWTAKDIESAGQQVASLPEFAKAKDGETIFGEVNGVRVGVIKTNGKIGTIFPDGTRQP
uniref:EndoU domain-containing protein n=3 Tax=Lactiplantibacillus plantarum TaxID=1590 RepID=UPI001EDA4F22